MVTGSIGRTPDDGGGGTEPNGLSHIQNGEGEPVKLSGSLLDLELLGLGEARAEQEQGMVERGMEDDKGITDDKPAGKEEQSEEADEKGPSAVDGAEGQKDNEEGEQQEELKDEESEQLDSKGKGKQKQEEHDEERSKRISRRESQRESRRGSRSWRESVSFTDTLSFNREYGTGEADGKKQVPFTELRKEIGTSRAVCETALRFLKGNWGVLLFLLVCSIGLAVLGVHVFDPLSWKAWAAFAIVLVTLALLIKNTLPTQVTMLSALVAMLLLQIVTPKDALTGFSNPGVAAVAILFIVAEGIQRTSVLMPVFRFVLGRPKRLAFAQLRLMLPIALVSAFLNNTPVVAMMIPVIQKWSRRAGFPISKLLMPMNNAAILGGTCTLLGTSTNLVVTALASQAELIDENGNRVGFSIFGVSQVGAPVLGVGLLYMLIASRFLLRDRGHSGVGAVIKNPREYTVALKVQERSPIVGETVSEAGLRQLQGLFLVELTRDDGDVIPAVSPNTRIMAGDILLFAGVVETVTELYHIPGLVPATAQSNKIKLERHRRRLVELVVSPSSVLTGRTVKQSKFRSRFRGAIIAVHRQGEHVKEKIADIELHAGDTLLVETGEDFVERYGKNGNFALVSEVSGSQPPREDRLHMAIAATLAVAMVALVVADLIELVTAASVVALLMVATRCMSLSNAAESVNLPVILTIAASFGVSRGMEESGAAEQLAGFIVDVFKSLGSIGLLFGIYVATSLLSAVITNNAAVTLMFPVVKNILKEKGLNVYAALYTLMLAASSSFSTPIGYQTNLMVHGPGGYTFLDWIVFGAPLQLIIGILTVLLSNLLFRSTTVS